MGSEDNDRERMRDIVERLNENIISDAFERRAIIDGALCERLIRERKEAAEEITRLRAEHKMAFEAVGDVVKANDDLRAENEKLRNEVMSDYHEGWEEGVKAERERCARIVEIHAKAVDGDKIAAAIRESGE